MMYLLIIILIYVIIGMYISRMIFSVLKDLPVTHISYWAAQETIRNLNGFIGFSIALFKWPLLVYILSRRKAC
jgi:hypothetical protein